MKRIFGAVAAVAVIAWPFAASAASLVARNQYVSGPQDRVNGSLYVAAGMASIGAPVSGDVLAAGGQLTVSGPVSGNVEAFGGNVLVSSAVAGSVRIVGGQVSISGPVSGDVVAAAGTVYLLPGSTVDGSVYAAGGQVMLGGTVRGAVTARADRLEVGSGAHVGGSLTYWSRNQAIIAPDAVISGAVLYHEQAATAVPVNFAAPGAMLAGLIAALFAARVLAFLGAAVVIVWLWRRQATDILQSAYEQWWPAVGRGIVYAIVAPIAAILLLMSFVGIIPGALLLMVYSLLLMVSCVLASILVGSLVARLFKKRGTLQVTWWSALGGVLLYLLFGIVPILGAVVKLLLVLGVFGVLAQRLQRMLA